jgi:hypothetical protein
MTFSITHFNLLFIAKNNVFVVVIHKMYWVYWFIVWRSQSHELSIKSYIKYRECTSFTHAHQQSCVIAFNMTDYCWRFHFADSLSLSEIPDLELISTAEQNVEFLIKVHWIDKTFCVKRSHKFSFLKRYSINLTCWRWHTNISVDRVINQISRIMRNPGFVMRTILSMKLNSSVGLSHGYLWVVVGQYSELNNFTIKTSETFQTELGSIKYFNLRTIDTTSNYVPLVIGYFNLVGGNLELKVLNELNSLPELIVITKRLAGFGSLFYEVLVSLTSRHVISLDPVDFCDFIHQQYFYKYNKLYFYYFINCFI